MLDGNFVRVGLVRVLATFIAVMGMVTGTALGQAQFFAIEPPPGYVGTIASGLSGDGSTVVGGFITQVYNRDNSPAQAFRWTMTEGPVGLGFVPGGTSSFAHSVSTDGSVILMNRFESRWGGLAHAWTSAGGFLPLPPAGMWPGSSARVTAVSGDGQVAVGNTDFGVGDGDYTVSTKWTGGVPAFLGPPLPDCGTGTGSDDSMSPLACSGDGSVIVGRYCFGDEPGIFEGSWRKLPMPDGATTGVASAVSEDGITAVGFVAGSSGPLVGVWRYGRYQSDLLFGSAKEGYGAAVSPLGDAIAGGSIEGAIVWSKSFGWRNLAQMLTAQQVNLAGWALHEAVGITVTTTGIVVTGNGLYQGEPRAWVARLCLDSDNDGLCDDWERQGGGIDVDGIPPVDLDLHALGCDPYRKNILVEIDTMPGYEIDNAVLDKLRLAFDNAPVRNPIPLGQTEPGPDGIDLIIDASESPIPIPPEVQVYPPPQALPLTYPSWRRDFFGTQQDRSLPPERRAAVIAAKKLVFRYGVGIASAYVQGSDGQPGGVLYGRAARGPSDDFFISIGLMNSGEDRFNKQAAAIMHELGHCLGLRHGGDDDIQAKPNYVSVMNYALIFPGDWNSTAWALDYSREALRELDERSLDEQAGLSSPIIPMAIRTPFGVGDCSNGQVDCTSETSPRKYKFLTITRAGEPAVGVDFAGPAVYDDQGNLIDWQCCPDDVVSAGVSVAQDLNRFNVPAFSFSGQGLGRLSGHDDWAAIVFAPVGKAIESTEDLVAFPVEPGCPTVEGVEGLDAALPPDAENPVPGFGTVGGSNARTFVYRVPYVFGDGARTRVLWSRNLDVAPYDARRPGESSGIVFDENGDLYWRSVFASAQTQSGVVKTRASDGSLVWVSPLPDGPNVQSSFNVPPIVGYDAVYCSRTQASSPTVYALDKQSGALLWQSAPLPFPVGLGMSLESGVLYGVTKRTAAGVVHAFAIRAADGQVLWTLPIQQPTDTVSKMNTTLLRRAGPNGGHVMYWMFDGNSSEQSGLRAVEVTPSMGTVLWTVPGMRSSNSQILYNDRTESLYACHWADYGSAVESIDPRTGTVRWRARPVEFGPTLSGGFSPCHVLRPDGRGLIFAGFGGDIWSLRDPGPVQDGVLPSTAADWHFDGDSRAGEPRSLAVAIEDPTTGDQIFITGTSSTADYPRRLTAQRIDTTSPNGERLWEWQNPEDPSPNASASLNFRSLSVGPDGTLYYFDSEGGPQGTLIAVGVTNCLADFNQDGGIDGADVGAFFNDWESGLMTADVNQDGGIDGGDVESFFAVWEAGGCN